MKQADKKHLSRVADLGCIVCRNEGLGQSAASIHHIRKGQGMGQRASHQKAIPLCPIHHQHGGYRVAIHAGQKAFESRYGTETELLEQVLELLA